MAAEHLLATLEQTLRQTRASRARLASRLADLEQETEALRAEIEEMDTVAVQTEETIYRVMSTVLGGRQTAVKRGAAPPLVMPHLAAEAAPARFAATYAPAPQSQSAGEAAVAATEAPPASAYNRAAPLAQQMPGPVASPSVAAALDERFAERTIPQAVAALLRDAGGPLHVNDIYQQLLVGGFVFSGHNPTISIATSLSRNSRFRRVAPSTFDLVMREAALQAS